MRRKKLKGLSFVDVGGIVCSLLGGFVASGVPSAVLRETLDEIVLRDELWLKMDALSEVTVEDFEGVVQRKRHGKARR